MQRSDGEVPQNDVRTSRHATLLRRAAAATAWAGAILGVCAGVVQLTFPWRRVVCAVVTLACAVICFTTVGALWYLPGPLLIVATVAAPLAAWLGQRELDAP
jgi:hypothetical protein